MASFRGIDLRDFLMNGSPSATLNENFSRDNIAADLVASLTTQIMTSIAMPLVQGDVVTSLTFLSGATALGTPVNEWAALYDTAGNLLAQSTSVSTAWAADTAKTFTLATPVTITATGVYYAALMVQATIVPTLMGKSAGRAAAAGAIVPGQKVLSQTSGAGLTTTAPATIATPTTIAVVPYCAIL